MNSCFPILARIEVTGSPLTCKHHPARRSQRDVVRQDCGSSNQNIKPFESGAGWPTACSLGVPGSTPAPMRSGGTNDTWLIPDSVCARLIQIRQRFSSARLAGRFCKVSNPSGGPVLPAQKSAHSPRVVSCTIVCSRHETPLSCSTLTTVDIR